MDGLKALDDSCIGTLVVLETIHKKTQFEGVLIEKSGTQLLFKNVRVLKQARGRPYLSGFLPHQNQVVREFIVFDQNQIQILDVNELPQVEYTGADPSIVEYAFDPMESKSLLDPPVVNPNLPTKIIEVQEHVLPGCSDPAILEHSFNPFPLETELKDLPSFPDSSCSTAKEKDMGSPIVDVNGTKTGPIISTAVGGQNGEPKQDAITELVHELKNAKDDALNRVKTALILQYWDGEELSKKTKEAENAFSKLNISALLQDLKKLGW